MKDDLVEAVARALYDELEGGINNQDYSRQLRQWERAKGIALAVIVAARPAIRREALAEAAKVAETKGVYPELNIEDGGPEWYRHGLAIAADLRALGEKP
jgi:hypothetical protein